MAKNQPIHYRQSMLIILTEVLNLLFKKVMKLILLIYQLSMRKALGLLILMRLRIIVNKRKHNDTRATEPDRSMARKP